MEKNNNIFVIISVSLLQTPCMSSPCQNGAKCIPSYANNDYFCKCEEGFTGEHCEKGTPFI